MSNNSSLSTTNEEQERRSDVNDETKNTFTYTMRSTNIELDEDWYSISDTCRILQLSPVWVRRQIKQSKFKKTKKVDGKWWISKESILTKLEYLEEKDTRLEKRSRGEETTSYQVPSIKSCFIIRRRVKEDTELTDQQRELFLERIDSYEEFFTTRLSKIREERK